MEPTAAETSSADRPRDPVVDLVLDGNALAGPLGEVFGVEVTAAAITCEGCDRRQAVAELVVYASAMGAVARCQGCGRVMLRVAHLRSGVAIDLRGSTVLRVGSDG